MMNYKIVNQNWVYSESNQRSFEFCDILETTTNQTVNSNIKFDEAKKLVRHLNLGGGFDGFTPAFFLNKISPTGA